MLANRSFVNNAFPARVSEPSCSVRQGRSPFILLVGSIGTDDMHSSGLGRRVGRRNMEVPRLTAVASVRVRAFATVLESDSGDLVLRSDTSKASPGTKMWVNFSSKKTRVANASANPNRSRSKIWLRYVQHQHLSAVPALM